MSKPKSAKEEVIMIGFPPEKGKTVALANWQDPPQRDVNLRLLGNL